MRTAIDEKTHDPKFAKEIAAHFKRTTVMKHNRTDAIVFPVAAQAIDALAILMALARDIVNRNAKEPRLTSQSWQLKLEEPLKEVAEKHNIVFPIFLYNIAPYLLLTFAQLENNLDQHQEKLYLEALERAKSSEILAYWMAGFAAVNEGSTCLIQKMVMNKTTMLLFRFLVYGSNQRNWMHAMMKTIEPAGLMLLKTQFGSHTDVDSYCT